MNKDYYVVLRVPPQATPDQIHSAYRHRARELHPDVSGADCEPFLELQEAYSVLGNPERRSVYDRSALPIRRGEHSPCARSSPRAEPFRSVHVAWQEEGFSLFGCFETFGPSFDEVFDRLWSNFGSFLRPKAERVENLLVDVPLSREQAFEGGHVRVNVPSRALCSTCRGEGGIGHYVCWRCNGQGALILDYPLTVQYPRGMHRDHVVQVSLDSLGIRNLYLSVRFRVTGGLLNRVGNDPCR